MNVSKSVSIGLFLLLSPQVGLGQAGLPVGTTWHYQFTEGFDQCSYPYTNKYIRYYASKDTVVNSQDCQIIECHMIGDFWNNGTIDTTSLGREVMYGNEQYVFVYRDGKFYKVFDFTASIGDTITVIDTVFEGFFYRKNNLYNLFEYIIDSISNAIVGTDTLVKFYVSPTDSSDWVIDTFHFIIAGVGIDGVIFEGFLGRPLYLGFVQAVSGPLRCFNNTVNSYNFMNIPCDTICLDPNPPIGIESKGAVIKGFEVYPNPVNELLLVQVNHAGTIVGCEIYNLMGERMVVDSDNIESIDSGSISITVKHLKRGVYVLKLSDKSDIFYSKFIKM